MKAKFNIWLACRACESGAARVAIHLYALLTRHEGWRRAAAGIGREVSEYFNSIPTFEDLWSDWGF